MTDGDGGQDLVDVDRPLHTPLTISFDGIIEGTVANRRALELALRALAALPAPDFESAYEGNSCSLLVDDAVLPGSSFTAEDWATLRRRLEKVIAAFDPREEVESTLRCSERFANHVRETLFVIDRAGLQLVSRERAADARDAPVERAADDDHASPLEWAQQRRSALALLALFLLAGALVVWHEGLVFRLFPASAASMRIASGDFAELLTLSTEQSWGSYRITLTRGPGFPTTAADLAHRLSAATTLGARTATNLAAEGGDVFLVLEDGNGKALANVEVSLRPLLSSPAGHASCTLPGEGRAAGIRIDLAKPESGE